MSSRPAAPGSSPGARKSARHHPSHAADEPAVQRITSAPEPHSADLDRRMGRYLWQMGIRTGCFVGAFFASGWLQLVLIIGAIVLPYIAVVLANNGTVSNGEVLQQIPADQPALGWEGHQGSPTAERPDDGPVQGVVLVTRALPSGTGSHAQDEASSPTSGDGAV